MAKEKEIKTNAMRILDRQKIKYEVLQYECDEFIDGLHTAEKTGAPVEQSFKTLVAQGKSKQYYVLVLPIAEEVDLKKAAKAVGEKSIEMIHVKDITAVSGYSSGGFTIALAFAVDEMADPLRTDYCVTAFRCSVFLGGIYYYKER